MNSKNFRIAVTGMNASDNPGPGVAIIRAIRDSGEFEGEIIGLSYEPLDAGVYMSGICDHVYLMSYPSEGSYALLERIREIHSKTRIDVLMPTLDAELQAYIAIREELDSMGIKTFLPTMDGLELRSKSKFNRLAETMGISVPRGKSVSDAAALLQAGNELGYPLMVKGQFYDAYMAYSYIEAERLFRIISSKWGLPVVLQEFIEGDEYDVVALGDGVGSLIGAVPMKKLQLTDKGKAWAGVTVNDPMMNSFVEEIMRKLKWRGPCEFEIMKKRSDGSYYLIEINPRFPAWCYLAAGAGQNLPWAVVKLAMGTGIRPFGAYEIGMMYIRNSIDHIYPLGEYRDMTTLGEIHRNANDGGNHGKKEI